MEEEKKIIATAVSALEERDRQIIEMRFGIGTGMEEKTQKQVADELGISQSYISRLEKKILTQLKKEILKLGT
jgi:RNA polymerase sporulation-specific sigma factor